MIKITKLNLPKNENPSIAEKCFTFLPGHEFRSLATPNILGISRLLRCDSIPRISVIALCGLFLTGTGNAADDGQTAAALVPQKPAWLTDLSLGVKESYEVNVFELGAAPSGPVETPTPGSVVATKNVDSFVTTVSPKVGVNFAPLLGDQKTLQALTLAYAPDFVTYHDASSENYNAHRLAAAVRLQTGDWSLNVNEGFNYIDGNKYGPTYQNDLLSAFATAADRERREQIQERGAISLKYDQDKWFVRPTASLLDYNLMTPQYFFPGYQNYIDRYDVNGGLDFGYKIQPQSALTLGYRYGHQYQQEFTFAQEYPTIPVAAAHSPNDYQRVLVGYEGKPWNWLTANLQIGPDFRSFGPDAPLDDKNPVTYYGEAAITATVTPKDTIAFKYRQWEWVSSTGLVPYFDSTFDLSYVRKVTDALSMSLGARALGADYNPNNVASQTAGLGGYGLGERAKRDDWQYTLSAGLQYAFAANLSANLTYSYDLGVNEQGGLTEPGLNSYLPRSFNHQLVSLGMTFKY